MLVNPGIRRRVRVERMRRGPNLLYMLS
jgi:hypothetical protein